MNDEQNLAAPTDPLPTGHLPEADLSPKEPKHQIWLIVAIVVVVGVVGAAAIWWHYPRKGTPKPLTASVTTKTASPAPSPTPVSSTVQGLQLDSSKNYGNKYASGILPVGDGKYVTSAPQAGSIYACSQYAQSLTSGQGGAGSRGPWFVDNNTAYNVNKKLHVEGDVNWQSSMKMSFTASQRVITTNGLPTHPTGVFPIASSDPAYAYDRNPNRIQTQSLTYSLPLNPTYGGPTCMGGEVGVMLTGVPLFNAFDAGGRDAGAWEVQDGCNGHPQMDGEYHYHTLSSCIKDTSVSTVIGFALDGFPITGPKVATNNILTTSDLDECHGLTSQITLDGKTVTSYHYVMTQDFPYSASCFRGQAIQPPGDHQSAPPH